MQRSKWGFSLLEVVIVVAILAILAAMALPRMSRSARGANESALSADLAVLRHAVDLYTTEHGGTSPSGPGVNDQLTQYTDLTGVTSVTKTTTHIYGPYLTVVPPIPVGARQGARQIATADANDVGWLYTPETGTLKANTTTETDDAGKLYCDY